eukprot:gene33629-40680_t
MTTLSFESVGNYLLCSYGALSGGGGSLGSCYLHYDSLTIAFAFCAIFIAYSFIWSIVGWNASKVDQLWSVTPVLYAWHFYAHYRALGQTRGHHDRLLVLCVLISLWGVRLTYNFWKKGGYGNFFHHEEDYRWPIIRAKMHPFLFWVVFNFSFIASYQNILLLLIVCPAYEVMTGPTKMNLNDHIVAVAFYLLWCMESLADLQHYKFQTLKYSLTSEQRAAHADGDIRRGFFASGLFAYSRHPNYFAEQSMWVVVYLFSCTHEQQLSGFSSHLLALYPAYQHVLQYSTNWSILGSVLLILLFQGSATFGESITVNKYPTYRVYQRHTSQFFPWFPMDKSLLDAEEKKIK